MKGAWVYVSGPMSKGNSFLHVRGAIIVAERLRRAGMVPFVPHLSCLWEMIAPGAAYEEWIALDLAYLERCDALLRLPGESVGADIEEARMHTLGKPVFHQESDLYAWVRGKTA
jgi:hypothetical protein